MCSEVDIPPFGGIGYFRIAKDESRISNFRQRVGACLVKGKKIFRGYNKKKTHTIFANPNFHVKTSIHAELSCLINAGRYEDLNGSKIFVYRESSDGNPAMARPCEHCMKFMKERGVKEIYYTTNVFPYWAKEVIK